MDFSKRNSDILVCNASNVENIKHHVEQLTIFLEEHSKLVDSYILDYFVEELWTLLPRSWLDIVMKFEITDIVEFLDAEKHIDKDCWPASLLSFREQAFNLALPRKAVKTLQEVKNFINENYKSISKSTNIDWGFLDSGYENKSGQHKNIPEFCRRHVKPKKQHEVFRMGQLVAAVLEAFGIKDALDVGSGQGHLSRYLALCYNLNVTTVEAEHSRVSTATSFDKQALKSKKILEEHLNLSSEVKESCFAETIILPHHIEGLMTVQNSDIFFKKELFAILGLHTCGDLAATIFKFFTECQNSRVLLSVGCCYMKNAADLDSKCYPLSSYVTSLPNHHLTYEAKEMACHALEMYIKRLKENASSLKIHCYRATLEKCIVHHYPDRKHLSLRGVKHAEFLPFPVYAERALNKVSCVIPESFYSSPEIQSCLDQWKDVLIYYSLRLLIAPVVESLILLDRMLFLYEHGYSSCLLPLFDPSISPRNYIIISACEEKNL